MLEAKKNKQSNKNITDGLLKLWSNHLLIYSV
jgi:hypothetical protein